MNREHDDDMSAEVGESGRGEADQYAVVAEDVERRDAEAAARRLREIGRHLEHAEGEDGEEP